MGKMKSPKKYFVGYRGRGQIMYGRRHFWPADFYKDRKQYNDDIADYAEPMTLNNARAALKQMPCRNAAIFEIIEVEVRDG